MDPQLLALLQLLGTAGGTAAAGSQFGPGGTAVGGIAGLLIGLQQMQAKLQTGGLARRALRQQVGASAHRAGLSGGMRAGVEAKALAELQAQLAATNAAGNRQNAMDIGSLLSMLIAAQGIRQNKSVRSRLGATNTPNQPYDSLFGGLALGDD